MFSSLWLRRLQRRWLGRGSPRALQPRRRSAPPSLEMLEERVTPSTVINVNDPSGGMDNPANVTVSTLSHYVTLRDAINAADNSGGSDSYLINLPAGKTITFASPVNNTTVTSYTVPVNNTTISLPTSNTIQNQNWYGPNALPAITSNIQIEGNGDTLQISGANMRFFYVSGGPNPTGGVLSSGKLELDDLTLEGGMAVGGNGGSNRSGGGGGLGAGGAIFNQGILRLNGDTLTNNQAIGGNGGSGSTINSDGGGGGGMGSNGDSTTGGGFGGGFSINGGPGGGTPETFDGGGGGAGFRSVDNGANAFANHGGDGGGLGDFGGSGGGGDTGNATFYGGGSNGDGGGGGGGYGGVYGGGFGNGGSGGFSGGDLYGSGGGGGGIGGGGGAGIGTSDADSGSGGGGFGGGGGGGTFSTDHGGSLGGPQSGGGAAGSRAGGGGFGGGGGGSPGGNPGGGGFGGANGGKTSSGSGGGGAGMGGAIFNMFGSLVVINSTLADNTAKGGLGAAGGAGLGGALFNLDANAILTYVTVANNNASTNGGGVYNLAYGNTPTGLAINDRTLSLNNSVIGQNSGGNDLVNDAENGKNTNTAQIDGSSSVVQGGAQQLGNGANTVADGAITVTAAPNLATTLANYGGLTDTLAPNRGSPVIGAGNGNIPGLPAVDENGIPRQASKPDDGAFQTGVRNITTITTVASATTAYNSAGQTVLLTAKVVNFWNQPITEGVVTFQLGGLQQSVNLSPSNPGEASTEITLSSAESPGVSFVFASYADTGGIGIYENSSADNSLTIQPANSSINVTVTNGPIDYNSSGETLNLQATLSSSNGGTVQEGNVVIAVNGVSSVTLPVSGNLATTTLNLSGTSLLNAGSYTNIMSAFYTDDSNDYTAAHATTALTIAAPATTVTPQSVTTSYDSTTAQTLTLRAAVATADGGPVNEGSVTFTVAGAKLKATANVIDGTATATLTLPAGFAAGAYSLTASYADPNNANGTPNYQPSTSTNAATLTVAPATVAVTALNTTSINSADGKTAEAAPVAANVIGTNGGSVNEGTVTFTLFASNGINLVETVNVNAGAAETTLQLPLGVPAGTYAYTASYAAPNNANGTPNYAKVTSGATVTLTVGSGTAALGSTKPPAAIASPVNPPVANPSGGISLAMPPTAPVGSLSAFALGLGPTGIDLLEVDSQGDVFAQGLFGGGLQLVNTSLQLPWALMSNDGLLALLAGDNGQNYLLDVFDAMLPFVEPAAIAALHL